MSSGSDFSCQDRWHDDLAAYVLGALGEEETAALERHLAECEACSDRLLWLQPAVDLVPASVPQLDPPPELKQRLMAVVEEEAGASSEPAPAPRRRRFSLRLPSLVPMRPALAGLAALVVLVAGLGGYLIGGGDGGGADPSGSESFAVKPLSAGLKASGTVEIDEGQGTLTINDLPQVQPDEVYQVWTVKNEGEPQPASVFVPQKGGRASAAIPEVPDGTERLLITREPAGGSEQASSEAVLAASLDG